MTKVEVDLDDIDQIYINVFSAKSRLSCFANIANADADYDIISSVESRHAAEVLSSDSSDSDKIYEDFGAMAMEQVPLQNKKNKSNKKKQIVKNSEEVHSK